MILRFAPLAVGLLVAGMPAADRPLVPNPAAVAAAPPELLERVRSDPFNYFRMVNREWTIRACEIFAADLPGQPIAQLHGDAHIEQYAFTEQAWGLDDFDDSARGPALVDILRFLGSLDLAVRKRGWTAQRGPLVDRFFEGYRRGLADPSYLPPEPGVVTRLRRREPVRTHREFLAWTDRLTSPMEEARMPGVIAGMRVFAGVVLAERPELTRDYFEVGRAGWLHMGIGSAALPKVLIRLRGPSPDPADDVILEAKLLRALDGVPCLEVPVSRPAFRIVAGNRQVGRLHHEILAYGPDVVIPEMAARRQDLRYWWIRNWEASYREVALGDFRTIQEFSDVVFDAGVQLGAGRIHGSSGAAATELTSASLASLAALEPRLRAASETLVQDLLAGWREIRRR